MYVAVKGGEAAIANAHRLLADRRRGDRSLPAISSGGQPKEHSQWATMSR